jgi:hypothetical protein
MALNALTLQADILSTFLAMNDIVEDGDKYQAKELAIAIKKYFVSGQTSTTDSGAAPAGSYTGKGTGTMTIDASQLEKDLLDTFDAKYDDNDLADHLATDIDNACKADKTVQETSSGTVTTPSGATSSFSGAAEGKFTGTKVLISSALKTCFVLMKSMLAGGNQFYAQAFSMAIDSYAKAGTISVSLKVPPFASGSGSGKIT